MSIFARVSCCIAFTLAPLGPINVPIDSEGKRNTCVYAVVLAKPDVGPLGGGAPLGGATLTGVPEVRAEHE